MKRDTVNYAAVGGFVLLMLLALAAGLYFITGRGGPMDEYHAYYGNVAGVKYGTPVYFEGYSIGQVQDVQPEHRADGMRYRVTLGVRKDWPIPKDSVAAVSSTGLLSDVSIAILEGKSRERLAPGAEMLAQDGADVFTAFSQLALEVKALATGIRPLVQQLNVTLGEGAAPIVADMRSLLAKLNQSADSLNQLLGSDNRREISQILQRMNQTTANAEQLTKDLTQTRQQVDRLLAETNGMVTENRPELRQSVADLRASLQAVSGRIDTIMQQLETSSRNMQEFSRQIRANPGRLLTNTPPPDEMGVQK